MGAIQSLFSKLFPNKDVRIVMLGLDAAGKTTVLYKLKLGEVVTTIPTIGFNVETIQYKKLEMTCWDVGGQTKIRPLWRHYYDNSHGLIFIVDGNDQERFDEARQELHGVLRDPAMKDVRVLVFANKQDLPQAAPVAQIADSLDMHKLKQKWYIQSTSALSGDGLFEGLDWLARAVNETH